MNATSASAATTILNPGFVRAYIVTMRPYLMFVSGITGIAGLSFAPPLPAAGALAIALASFLSYGFGQALTDCFQIDTDSISAPYRPLTQHIISRSGVLLVSVTGLIGCVTIFSLRNPANALLGLIAGLGLATYTPFKRRWWAGPFYNAWIVAVLCVMAFIAGHRIWPSMIDLTFLLTLSTVFFGYANFVLTGYFKDTMADRATGYNTLPVVFGRRISALVSDGFALLTILSVLAIAAQTHFGPDTLVAGGFLLTGMLVIIVAQVWLHRVRGDRDAHRPIAAVVHGYILLLAGIAAMQQPRWALPLALFYGAFVLVMKNRPEKSQI